MENNIYLTVYSKNKRSIVIIPKKSVRYYKIKICEDDLYMIEYFLKNKKFFTLHNFDDLIKKLQLIDNDLSESDTFNNIKSTLKYMGDISLEYK